MNLTRKQNFKYKNTLLKLGDTMVIAKNTQETLLIVFKF